MEHKLVTITAGDFKPAQNDGLYEIRRKIVSARAADNKAAATIFVQGFNRIEKTRQCIESILKHTKDVEFRLLLIDSGSSDGTLEYFKSVPHENTVILHFPKNISAAFSQYYFAQHIEGRYIVQVNNDIVVTPRWLSNLIKCAESDIRIGMVNPVSSNVSNLQQIDLNFSSPEEMEKAANEFNKSNPKMWEERIRLITLGTLYTREALEAVGGLFDTGFIHDFSDDDMSYRIRRAGYKLVLAKDTWVHHNHDFRNLEDKSADGFKKSIESGRKNFKDKFGLDSWLDGINYEKDLAGLALPQKGEALALGLDCRCGQPLLDLKNSLREKGSRPLVLSAFEYDAKYYTDLLSVCDGLVACDREEFITTHFAENQFNYVLVAKPINEYHEPYKLLQDIARLCKNGAQLLLKLTNVFGREAINYMQTNNSAAISSYPIALPLEVLVNWLESTGFGNGQIVPQYRFNGQDDYNSSLKTAESFCSALSCKPSRERILASEYHISVVLKK